MLIFLEDSKMKALPGGTFLGVPLLALGLLFPGVFLSCPKEDWSSLGPSYGVCSAVSPGATSQLDRQLSLLLRLSWSNTVARPIALPLPVRAAGPSPSSWFSFSSEAEGKGVTLLSALSPGWHPSCGSIWRLDAGESLSSISASFVELFKVSSKSFHAYKDKRIKATSFCGLWGSTRLSFPLLLISLTSGKEWAPFLPLHPQPHLSLTSSACQYPGSPGRSHA